MKNKSSKYIASLLIAMTLTTSVFANTNSIGDRLLTASASDNQKPNYFDNYTEEVGEVIKVVNQNDFKRVIAKNDKEEIVSYNVYPYTPVLNYASVLYSPVVGDRIQVVYKKGDKSTDVNPPQVDAMAVIILDAMNSYKAIYDTYDENLVAHNKKTALKLFDTSVYLDMNMNPISLNDLKESTLIVFYSVGKGKSPEEIIAKKIVKINASPKTNITVTINSFLKSLPEGAIYNEGEIDYIRLNNIAKEFGYTTSWNAESNSITMESNKNKFVFEIGNSDFMYNNTKSHFTNAPILHDESTYISYDFALDVMYKHYLND